MTPTLLVAFTVAGAVLGSTCLIMWSDLIVKNPFGWLTVVFYLISFGSVAALLFGWYV